MKGFHGRMAFGLLGILTAVLLSSAYSAHAGPAYQRVNLVSDIDGVAEFTDPNLVNPWGIVVTPTGRLWIADNHTGVSTVYGADGTPQSLVVTIPSPVSDTSTSAPTGMVGNNTGAFVVSNETQSAASFFIWATEDGTIAGWNPAVNPTQAVLAVDNSGSEAVYKGLARGADSSSNEFLFAANFHDGVVEKYDKDFKLVSSFTDTALPAGYAPFGIHNIDGKLFVTFALQKPDKQDDQAGPGNGFVDVFDVEGNLVRQFAAHGTLNSPWGLAHAPSRFGKFSNALLVGNFGDGRINAFDLVTGAFLGQLTDRRGNPIAINGLWGLVIAQVQSTGDEDGSAKAKGHEAEEKRTEPVLYFTAGLADEEHGLFGLIRPIRARSDHDH
jgi:uncharacterized protein (TIGR03118 family)